MKICDEKVLLLQGIQAITEEIKKGELTIELFQRYNTLVACLVTLNWKECGHRKGEGLHNVG